MTNSYGDILLFYHLKIKIFKVVYQTHKSNGFVSELSFHGTHIPPLYFPKNCRQFGHLWVTEFNESMQHGTHAHGHNPTTHSIPAKIHARAPGSESVDVLT